jgi:hypothetical protein
VQPVFAGICELRIFRRIQSGCRPVRTLRRWWQRMDGPDPMLRDETRRGGSVNRENLFV